MATFNGAAARRLVFNIHLWVALILFLPLVPLGLTGSALMFPQLLNDMGDKAPTVAADAALARTPTQLLQAGMAALPQGSRPQTVRFPEKPGEPAALIASGDGRGPGARIVWLDPASGQVLKTGSTTSAAFRFAHDFHGRFMVSGPGRLLVGWAGVAMLLLSLTGIWLWWPRGAFAAAFRWRRTPDTLDNLHHFTGFWLSIPLAVVSITGILIAFPALTSVILGGPPPQARAEGPARPPGGGARRPPRLSADEALAIAQAAHPGARPASINLPGAGTGRPGPADPAGRTAWRVELLDGPARQTVLVDDRSGQVRAAPAAAGRPNGPMASVRRIHEGEVAGPIWRWLVFLTGPLPLLLAFTGVTLWIRNEARRRRMRSTQAT